MPFGTFRNRRRFRPRRHHRRPTARVGASIGRAPRWKRGNRVAQNLARNVFWFKTVDSVLSSSVTPGTIGYFAQPDTVVQCNRWDNIAPMYKQFKVLKMIVKFYPANIGAETIGIAGGPGVQLQQRFYRGDTITWADQEGNVAAPPNIQSKMGNPSTRYIIARRFHKRWLDRPRGYNLWDELNLNGSIAPSAEYWNPSINLFGTNYSEPIVGLPHYYVMKMYKVLFRSMRQV